MHTAAWVDFKNSCGMKGIFRKEYILYNLINRGSMCEHVRSVWRWALAVVTAEWSYHLISEI